MPVCEAPGGIPCDDGEPCTDDLCFPGVGCEHADKTGVAAVTCTCERELPAECADQAIPKRIQNYRIRACRLFSQALQGKPGRQRHRLKQGAKGLRRGISAVVQAQLRGLAPECAAALADQFRDASDRATLAADQI